MHINTKTSEDWITELELEPHIEGGFFKRIYQADHRPMIETVNGPRFSMTSIYYLLNSDSPTGRFHLNTSDIMHVFVAGDPIRYTLINDATGDISTQVLGHDIKNGQSPTLAVPGGTWKASDINLNKNVGYGLLTEAVVPGFDFSDMTLGQRHKLLAKFPQHSQVIYEFTPD